MALGLLNRVLASLPVAFLRVITAVAEWMHGMRAKSLLFDYFWDTTIEPFLPFAVTDSYALNNCKDRFSLTFAGKPYQVDPREREFAAAIIPLRHRVFLQLTSRIKPNALLYGHPWLGYISLRTNLIDKYFLNFIQGKGSRQVVILGAGYDFRAFRFYKERTTRGDGVVRVIEVERSAVLEQKLLYLQEGISKARLDEVSQGVTYVPCNFEYGTEFEEKLTSCTAFVSDAPTLFICEGVMAHLSCEAVKQTLKSLHSLSVPGVTQLIIDSPEKEFVAKKLPSALDDLLLRYFRVRNIPLNMPFPSEPDECAAFCQEYGFSLVKRWDVLAMMAETVQGDDDWLLGMSSGARLLGMRVLYMKAQVLNKRHQHDRSAKQ